MSSIRTRFAPSPTGLLHIGNVRAALFPWLLARHYGGKFILRIEDTDQSREVEGAVETIKQTLGWLGIEWDEGPDIGGPYGPYVQSKRLNSYNDWAKKLLASGNAYADSRTPTELDALRKDALSKKQPFLARNYRPEHQGEWLPGVPLRFKSNPKPYSWHDEIMGDLSAGEEAVDDFIVIKSDGMPTYNFAHIVDDHDMEITHVIRGLEYIASTPKFLNLYEALGFDVPLMAHMPHIMSDDGKKKLSKRDGAKAILDYKRDGYLPAAMLNFLALLGWNDGTTKELFTDTELIKSFALNRVQKSGAKFDERRLLWMNGSYIRQLTIDELYEKSLDYWPQEARQYNADYKHQVLAVIQERLKYLSEISELTNFFFVDPPINAELITNNKKLATLSHDDIRTILAMAINELEDSDFSLLDISERLNKLLTITNQPPAILFSLIRIATTQAPSSPPLAESLAILGKDCTLRRIKQQISAL